MIHAEEKHREIIMKYLYEQPEINAFAIGDIYNYGFDKPFQDVWIDNETNINAVLVRYYENLCICSYNHLIFKDVIQELIDSGKIESYSGETSYIQSYNFDNFQKKTHLTLAHFTKENNSYDYSLVKKLNVEHLDQIMDLMQQCFGYKVEREAIKNEFLTNTCRAYGIFDGDKLVSMAKSTAESEKIAMVVMVCTDKEYRGKSYASKCTAKLSNELLSEGKIPCLYYVDPIAAKIYMKLGYENIGLYSMIRKSE